MSIATADSNESPVLPKHWGATKLGELAERFLSGGTPSTKDALLWQGDIPWITSKWLNENLYLTSGEKFISCDAVEKSATSIVPSNSLIFATRVGVGKVSINKIDLAINQDLAGIIIPSDKAICHLSFTNCVRIEFRKRLSHTNEGQRSRELLATI